MITTCLELKKLGYVARGILGFGLTAASIKVHLNTLRANMMAAKLAIGHGNSTTRQRIAAICEDLTDVIKLL